MRDFSEVNWGFSASQKADELERRVKVLERGLRILLRFLDGQSFGPLPIAHDDELLKFFQNKP